MLPAVEQRRQVGEERRDEPDRRRTAPAIANLSGPPARERAHRRADGEQREEEREVVDPGDADQHHAGEQPPESPPRGAVPELGDRWQRGVGPEDLHAQQHDHRNADVEREVLVADSVAEVVRREREEHRADQRVDHEHRSERSTGNATSADERKRQQPEQVERERNVARRVDDRLLHRVGERGRRPSATRPSAARTAR